MFHRAVKLEFQEGTVLDLTFQSGEVKRYDVARLFEKYPQLTALNDRDLFKSGHLSGTYGIVWNDDLDLDAESVYDAGELVRTEEVPLQACIGNLLAEARARAGMTQYELSKVTGIDQSDISKIERGAANPSLLTLERLLDGLNMTMSIEFNNKP